MKIELAKTEVIHFVGIGGIGMSGLSLVMKGMGFNVQGSDIINNKNIDRLKKNKIKILIKNTKKNITIKKPNDLLIENKKICGILQEVIEFKNDKFLITGVGINTSITPTDKKFTSTCLQEHTKKIIKNLNIIKKLKNAYEKMIKELENNNFTFIKNKYI